MDKLKGIIFRIRRDREKWMNMEKTAFLRNTIEEYKCGNKSELDVCRASHNMYFNWRDVILLELAIKEAGLETEYQKWKEAEHGKS